MNKKKSINRTPFWRVCCLKFFGLLFLYKKSRMSSLIKCPSCETEVESDHHPEIVMKRFEEKVNGLQSDHAVVNYHQLVFPFVPTEEEEGRVWLGTVVSSAARKQIKVKPMSVVGHAEIIEPLKNGKIKVQFFADSKCGYDEKGWSAYELQQVAVQRWQKTVYKKKSRSLDCFVNTEKACLFDEKGNESSSDKILLAGEDIVLGVTYQMKGEQEGYHLIWCKKLGPEDKTTVVETLQKYRFGVMLEKKQ